MRDGFCYYATRGRCRKKLLTFHLVLLHNTSGYKPQWRSKTASQPGTCCIFQCWYLFIGWSTQCCGRSRWKAAISKRHRTNWNAPREGKLWLTHKMWLPSDDCRVLLHFQVLNVSVKRGSNVLYITTTGIRLNFEKISSQLILSRLSDGEFYSVITPHQPHSDALIRSVRSCKNCC